MQRCYRCLVVQRHLDWGRPEGETRLRWQLSVALNDWIRDGKIFIVSSCIFFNLGLKFLYFPFKLAQRGTVQPGWLSFIILLVKVLWKPDLSYFRHIALQHLLKSISVDWFIIISTCLSIKSCLLMFDMFPKLLRPNRPLMLGLCDIEVDFYITNGRFNGL